MATFNIEVPDLVVPYITKHLGTADDVKKFVKDVLMEKVKELERISLEAESEETIRVELENLDELWIASISK